MIPELDGVAGDWMPATDLAHLPSLRNQYGQGHVNHDLASMSWLASPPYTVGYHTGVLRVDGAVLPAHRYRWRPWGVLREYAGERLTVRTDARMALAADQLLWHISVTNTGTDTAECTVTQDLFAMVAHTEIGWGWLYDVPWTAGNHHDFMTLERIRASTRDGSPYLLGPGRRRLRLGTPRLPGIQRDAGTEAMSLAFELPRHVSEDTVYPYRHGAEATIRHLRWSSAGTRTTLATGEIAIHRDGEQALDAFELGAGDVLAFDLRLDAADQTGVVLTHGNHPDSLQVGVDAGRLWFGIAGEKEYAECDLTAGDWHTVSIAVAADRAVLSLDGGEVAATGHWMASPRWKALSDGALVTIADSCSPARAAYAFTTPPGSIDDLGAGARAAWTVRLEPGATASIGIVCAYGIDADDVSATASQTAGDFTGRLARDEDGYRDLWRAMFTPGNQHFSGHLPTLNADDPGIARSYYTGALLALYMRNIRVSGTEPVFLTGGPRLGPTTTYFWDHTEWSRLYALLEPAGLRSWLLRALSGPYDRSFGFDTRNGGPLGNDYVSNDYALYRLAEHYVCVTGDVAFLDEPAGSRTVFEHLDGLAHAWRDKRTTATGGVLADFGPDPWLLLECVPNYVNVVGSFNAAYVGMMRSFAGLLRSRGRHDEAAVADTEADAMARAVVGLAAPGGRWQIRHPDRTESIGHSLDFGLIASYLHADLPEDTRAEMVAFVETKLIAATWMRALAPDDPAAPLSNRPDHGAAGAFCAWPGVTAHGLARLGRPDLAAELLRVAHHSTSGALWGQAMEIMDDGRVRVAEDGVSNRDSIGGVATAEAVLSGLFDFDPSFRRSDRRAEITLPGVGTLSNINCGRDA